MLEDAKITYNNKKTFSNQMATADASNNTEKFRCSIMVKFPKQV